MVHDPALLDALERLDTESWRGRAYRHMLGSASPELANVREAIEGGSAAGYAAKHGTPDVMLRA